MFELWRFLKERMSACQGVAVRGSRTLTYPQLIEHVELRARAVCGESPFYIAEAASKEVQAVAVLVGLAAGKTVVPLTDCYGREWRNRIRRRLIWEGNGAAQRGVRGLLGEPLIDDGVALLMFTSGSTGKPKGVMLSQENVLANLRGISSYFSVGEGDTVCIARPLVHIAVLVGEFLYALCRGATVVFYEEAFQPKRLASFLEREGVTVFGGTPTLYRFLCPQAERLSLRAGVLSGECMPADLPRTLRKAFPHTDFYHVYGLTECGPRVSALTPEEFDEAPTSVGRPLPEIELRIEDGELWVRSPGVMKGYWRDGAQTTQRLRGGWLRTGDMARLDAAGRLYIDGRRDDMIIRGGVNIYPAEIEAVVRGVPGVAECVAFGRKTYFGQEVCLRYAGTPAEAELRRELAERLPPHLLPTRIERCEALERTPSGKVRRP